MSPGGRLMGACPEETPEGNQPKPSGELTAGYICGAIGYIRDQIRYL
jgi:hypothetical protein